MNYAGRAFLTLLVLCCSAAAVQAQSEFLEPVISVSPTSPDPGALVTVTLTVTNIGPADVNEVVIGIASPHTTRYVHAIASGGSPPEHYSDCQLYDCSPPVIATRVSRLVRGASVTIAVTVRILSAPGVTEYFKGLARSAVAAMYNVREVTTLVTVAGSGALPAAPPQLVPDAVALPNLPDFRPTSIALDPRTPGYLLSGANGATAATAPGVAVLDPAGALMRGAVDLSVPLIGWNAPVSAYSEHIGGSADRGGVMVAWSEAVTVYARAFESSTGSISPAAVIGEGGDPHIAYSAAARRFLIVWKSYYSDELFARLIALDGQPAGERLTLPNGYKGADPKVAWNPVTGEFAVLYVARRRPWPEPHAVSLMRLSGDGAVIGTLEIAREPYGASLAISVNERTGAYVVVWGRFGAEVSKAGRLVSRGLITRERLVPTGLVYNAVSNTFLLLGKAEGQDEAPAVQLNQYGAPLAAPIPTNLRRDPVLTSRSDAAEWRIAGTIGDGGLLSPRLAATQAIRTHSTWGGSTARLGGCTSPDPFAAMGGGACHGGGWLAPGMFLPGTGPACPEPDPFIALGGGTCDRGTWLAPAAPLPAGPPIWFLYCSTPDPFVALGGGTCVKNGWLPPGMPVPPVSRCSTPDPFVVLGGGRCVNGGWLPPTMPSYPDSRR